MIAVIVPTYGRADRLPAVAANIDQATATPHRTVFVLEEDDQASIDTCRRHRLDFLLNERSRNYAGAANTGYRRTTEPFLFAGSDDLRFHPGWDETALALFDGWFGVVGTNDLLNPYVQAGSHATHSLVARWYLDDVGGVVDEGPGSWLHEGYDHQYTDTEFIGTAKARARFRPCLGAVVEHMHFLAGKSPHDATYERAYADERADSARYDARRELWFAISR